MKDKVLEVKEGAPSSLKKGYFVVLLEGDVKQNMLNVIIKKFGLEDSIDRHLINLWRRKLTYMMIKNNLSKKDLFRLYKNFGGEKKEITVRNWIKGKDEDLLGPRDAKDLLVLGQIIEQELGDDELKENYILVYHTINEVRTIHRRVGRLIKKVIKDSLTGLSDTAKMSLEELGLYETIENNIYRIIDIKEVD